MDFNKVTDTVHLEDSTTTGCHNSEDSSLHCHCPGNLRSYIDFSKTKKQGYIFEKTGKMFD